MSEDTEPEYMPQARMSLVEKARFKLRNGWRNDTAALNQYFQACVQNWKIYKGKRDPKQVMKLQCIYRQAMYGDNKAPPPENMKNISGLRWSMWTSLRGMGEEMAKRRFITYLAEIDPMLIDVMADEKPPDGFCVDERNHIICAKCNTAAGCVRPLLDQYKIDLKDQLFDSEELWEPSNLRMWVSNALINQQCIWGKHKPVGKVDIKPFQKWFDKDENGGFVAYDPTAHVISLVEDLLFYHFDLGYQMQINLHKFGAEKFNTQAAKVSKIKTIYEELSGTRFVYEAPCRLKNPLCDERRRAEGGRNHTHPVTLDPPSAKDLDDYEASIQLREQCRRLGLKESTGVVENVQQRCEIYRKRIADFEKGLEISNAATERLDAHADKHAYEKSLVGGLARTMINRQLSDACHAMSVDHIVVLLKRGADPNFETNRGLTPLLCAVLNLSPSETIEEMIITLKCNVNQVNQYGITPLMIACRMKDTKMIHVLMRNGVSALQTGGRAGGERTAMHWCAIHGSEEEAKIIMEYVKEGGGDSLRITRALDSESSNGDTPLMLASRIRNGLMCRTLSALGANPNIRNKLGRNAYNIARTAGWSELADWLETKVGAGVAKLETYSDLKYDKKVRYGKVRMMEAVEQFGRDYLSVVHVSTSTTPIGPPSVANTNVTLFGERALQEQQQLVDTHQAYIEGRDVHGEPYHPPEDDPKVATLGKMTEALLEMLESIQKGGAAPNTECLAKPLGWTPLMCAVAVNNMRVLKLLVRNGADPDHPNSQGTNALMLACQMNSRECILELMEMGADINAVDNFGYTPLAYATSLPVPTHARKSSVDAITEGGSSGEAKRDASDLMKFALAYGFEALKKELEDAAAKSSDIVAQMDISEQKRSIRLLQSYGLSHVTTEKQMLHALESTRWRLVLKDPAEKSKRQLDKEYKEKMRQEREEEEARIAAELKAIEDAKPPPLRCPICTLKPQCSHFRTEETLRKFLEKNNVSSYDVDTTQLAAVSANMGASGKALRELQKKEEGDKVLKEVGIYDRKFDRSVLFANKYRPREMELDRIDKEKYMAMVAERDAAEEEEERLLMASTPAIEGSQTEREGGVAITDTYALSAGGNEEPESPLNKRSSEKWLSTSIAADKAEMEKLAAAPRSILKKTRESNFSENEEGGAAAQTPKKKITFMDGDVEGPTNPEYVEMKLVLYEGEENYEIEGEAGVQPIISTPRSKDPGQGEEVVISDESKDVESANSESEAKQGTEETKEQAVGEKKDNEPYREKPLVDDDKSYDVNTYEAGKITKITEEGVIDMFSQEKQADAKAQLTAEEARQAFLASNFKKKASNPLPKDQRRLLLFTKDPIDTEKYSVRLDKKVLTQEEKERIAKEERRRKRKGITDPIPKPPLSELTALAPMSLSGWLFLPMSDTVDSPLVEKLDLPMDSWTVVIEHVWSCFMKDWSLRLIHHSLPKPNDLKKFPIRCKVCHFGFVRLKASKKRKDVADGVNEMCFACVIRREIHSLTCKLAPDAFPKEAQKWPFLYRNEESRVEQERKMKADMKNLDVIKLPAIGDAVPTEILPGTRSLSPSRSQRLLEMDAHEEMVTRLRDGTMSVGGSIDSLSLDGGSVSSMDSGQSKKKNKRGSGDLFGGVAISTGKTTLGNFDNMSLDSLPPSLSAASVPSEFSYDTADRIDKIATGNNKAPETLLLPFLLAKGLFHEVERGARMMMGLKSVDEGEGMLNLVKALGLQAEMYKNMGLWPLALALCEDAVDLTIMLLGYQQVQSQNGLRLVLACLLKMRCIPLAREYTETLCRRIEEETLSTNNFKSSQHWVEADKLLRKQLVKHEDLWTKQIQPSIGTYVHGYDEIPATPSRNYNATLYKIVGVPGIYSMYQSRDGYSTVARLAFEQYCVRIDPDNVGKHAQFVTLCFRLRDCIDDDYFRGLVQIMVQKYLAKSLVEKCPSGIAKAYREATSGEHIKAVSNFMHYGMPIEVQVFDAIFLHSLHQLQGQFLLFYLRDGAAGLRNINVQKTSEAFNAIVTRLQVFCRVYISKEIVRKKRERLAEEKEAARLRYLEEHSSSEEDSDDDSDEESNEDD